MVFLMAVLLLSLGGGAGNKQGTAGGKYPDHPVNPLATPNDRDGDGTLNSDDLYPEDHDNDKIPDSADPDDDNDGVLNKNDARPFDHDNDGINDATDPDDDGDASLSYEFPFEGLNEAQNEADEDGKFLLSEGLTAGSYTLTASVSDHAGLKDWQDIRILVSDTPPECANPQLLYCFGPS